MTSLQTTNIYDMATDKAAHATVILKNGTLQTNALISKTILCV